ncbi:MAG: LytTR family DNA-binding domain-containing protein [Ignavibacteriales bacterium]|nr:LytTR family DNA-binding domain-containing protein [Ignavibacteriales bacterium]
MNVVIVEDEVPAIKLLKKMLAEADSAINILATLDSIVAAVEWFRLHPSPDLVVYASPAEAVQIVDNSNVTVSTLQADGQAAEKVELTCPIIFTTAYDEYAIRAFTVNSIDYLLKPLDRTLLVRALDKLKRTLRPSGVDIDMQSLARMIAEQRPQYRTRFLLPMLDRFVPIGTKDVHFFMSAHKQTFLITKDNKKFAVDEPLDALERELDPQIFFRANRQFIVQNTSIAAVHTYFSGKLKLSLRGSDEEVIISKEKSAAFKHWLDS